MPQTEEGFYEKTDVNVSLDFEFDISKTAFELLNKMYKPNILYRSVGIVLENFTQK